MPRQSDRIRWEISPGTKSILGYVGTLDPWAFQIWTGGDGRTWQLITQLPGTDGSMSQGESADPDELKARAERILREFIATLGAVFPGSKQDMIVRWGEVREGDEVLIDDGFVVAERVSVSEDDWQGTKWLRADISYRYNGRTYSGDYHADRWTAVRRSERTPEHLNPEEDR